MMRDFWVDDVSHWPLTRLVTECGVGEEPSERGSSVAQDGRLDRQRRLLRWRAAADEEESRKEESIVWIFWVDAIRVLLMYPVRLMS
mmetsp:Transcript_17418/g.24721  ORF Transcript_17418/g.24721 Transcript_17418/m.24721 type:complete len:87 (-) Transcript_17418:150-410(-)